MLKEEYSLIPLEGYHGIRQNQEHPLRNKIVGTQKHQYPLIYTQLINFESDEYRLGGENIEEARELIESGFEYVCKHENKMIFRKRK